jgi:hypothetical protein
MSKFKKRLYFGLVGGRRLKGFKVVDNYNKKQKEKTKCEEKKGLKNALVHIGSVSHKKA